MIGFRLKPLKDIHLGNELRAWREKKNLTPADAAKQANLQTKYILALESGNLDALPEPIYAKNFLKAYLRVLGLKQDKFLKIFEKENSASSRGKKEYPHKMREELKSHHFIASPKIFKIICAVFIGLIILGYLLWQINYLMKPPSLEVYYPKEDLITGQAQVEISGQTDPETILTINDQEVITDSQGNFQYVLGLQRGLNIVTIKARRRHSRTQVIYKKIILESSDREDFQ
ncbi:helix-turn-helix domain-containing protein [Patescibacteria group bacterium]|nr:helix-turn-helix domain-containing protein [Patescibacteria group bacterium]MBU1922159.1 helix-turn-helix domain-containing protein [Patescibacteria group bacterium]